RERHDGGRAVTERSAIGSWFRRSVGAALLVKALAATASTPVRASDEQRGIAAAQVRPPAPEMVLLPRAIVPMGSSREEVLWAATQCNREAGTQACRLEDFADELGGEPVAVETFWIDRREVSLGDYTHCVNQGGCPPLT